MTEDEILALSLFLGLLEYGVDSFCTWMPNNFVVGKMYRQANRLIPSVSAREQFYLHERALLLFDTSIKIRLVHRL